MEYLKDFAANYCNLEVTNPKLVLTSFDHEFGTETEKEFEYEDAVLTFKLADVYEYINDCKFDINELSKFTRKLDGGYLTVIYTFEEEDFEIEAKFKEVM